MLTRRNSFLFSLVNPAIVNQGTDTPYTHYTPATDLHPFLGHWTIDTGVHTGSCEPNFPILKQTKGHLYEESYRKWGGGG